MYVLIAHSHNREGGFGVIQNGELMVAPNLDEAQPFTSVNAALVALSALAANNGRIYTTLSIGFVIEPGFVVQL